MSHPTTYQRVEATNDDTGDTWLIREHFNNLKKAKAYFNTLRSGKRYARVSLEMWDKNSEHLGMNVWFRAQGPMIGGMHLSDPNSFKGAKGPHDT